MFHNVVTSIMNNIPLLMPALAIILPLFTGRHYIHRFCKLLFLLAVGVSGIIEFYSHAFIPQIATGYTSWYNSQFEVQVGLAYLALGISGIIAYFASPAYKTAVATMATVFLWGSAINHIAQLINVDSLTLNDLGLTFLSNLLIPVFLWVSLFLTSLIPPPNGHYRSL